MLITDFNTLTVRVHLRDMLAAAEDAQATATDYATSRGKSDSPALSRKVEKLLASEAQARKSWELNIKILETKLTDLEATLTPQAPPSPAPVEYFDEKRGGTVIRRTLGGIVLRPAKPIYLEYIDKQIAWHNGQNCSSKESEVLSLERDIVSRNRRDAVNRLHEMERERREKVLTTAYPKGPSAAERALFEQQIEARSKGKPNESAQEQGTPEGGGHSNQRGTATPWALGGLAGGIVLAVAAILSGGGLWVALALPAIGLIGGGLIDATQQSVGAPASPPVSVGMRLPTPTLPALTPPPDMRLKNQRTELGKVSYR